MSRNIGPKHKVCRRAGVKLCSAAKCPVTRRNMPPGVHGPKGYQKLTAYGAQMMEKQKAKNVYGLNERQFANLVGKARQKTGDTGEHLLNMLELRLDNVAYRLGLASTRPQARQIVTHGHLLVDGKKLTIPSAALKIGQTVSIKEKGKQSVYFKEMTEKIKSFTPPAWLALNPAIPEGKITSMPASLKEMKPLFDLKVVVEYYGR